MPERIAALRQPETRSALTDDLAAETTGLAVTMRTSWGQHFVNDVRDPALHHLEGRRISELAAERNVSDFDAFVDVAVAAKLEVGLRALLLSATPTSGRGNAVVEVLKDPRVVLGRRTRGRTWT